MAEHYIFVVLLAGCQLWFGFLFRPRGSWR